MLATEKRMSYLNQLGIVMAEPSMLDYISLINPYNSYKLRILKASIFVDIYIPRC